MINATTRSTGLDYSSLLICSGQPVPAGVAVRRDGRPITEGATDLAFTTAKIRDEELLVVERTQRRLDAGGHDVDITNSAPGIDSDSRPNTPLTDEAGTANPVVLTGPQREAASAIAGTGQLVMVVGPAGTGKTTALRPAVDQLHRKDVTCSAWHRRRRPRRCLPGTGVDADTLDKLLVEHRGTRPPEPRYRLGPGTTLVVDEAAMVPTAEPRRTVRARRSAVVAAGTGRGPAAVRTGRPGRHVRSPRRPLRRHRARPASTASPSRGNATQVPAVAPRRPGRDRPVRRARPPPRRHPRPHGRGPPSTPGGTAAQRGNHGAHGPHPRRRRRTQPDAQRRRIDSRPTRPRVPVHRRSATTCCMWETRSSPAETTAACAPTRDHMVRTATTGPSTRSTPTAASPPPGLTGTVRLPAGYVADDVELGYAQTSHANQGRTVDDAILYLDGPTDTRGIYVPLTRGRHTNHAYVAVNGEDTPADVLATSLARTWIDRPALEVFADLEQSSDGAGPTRCEQVTSRDPVEGATAERRRRIALVRRQAIHESLERQRRAAASQVSAPRGPSRGL